MTAQTFAVFAAQRGVRDGENELLPEQGLEVDPVLVPGEKVEVLGRDFGTILVGRDGVVIRRHLARRHEGHVEMFVELHGHVGQAAAAGDVEVTLERTDREGMSLLRVELELGVARAGVRIGIRSLERVTHREAFEPLADQRAGDVERAIDREVAREDDVRA